MSLDISLTATADLGGPGPYVSTVYEANYTHNVAPMWHRAGCYDALYRSDGKTAADILPALEAAAAAMEADPDDYRALDPPNGWGSYDTALPWLRRLAAACRAAPRAAVRVGA